MWYIHKMEYYSSFNTGGQPAGYMQLRMAMNAAQHKIVNLLNTL